MEYIVEQAVVSLAKRDEMYLQLLQKCRDLEPEYHRIAKTLSQTDREILDLYIGICEELEHQKVRLAISMLRR